MTIDKAIKRVKMLIEPGQTEANQAIAIVTEIAEQHLKYIEMQNEVKTIRGNEIWQCLTT